jgi:hypothetical protein
MAAGCTAADCCAFATVVVAAGGGRESTPQPKGSSVTAKASHAIDGRCRAGAAAAGASSRTVITGGFFGMGGGAAFTLGGASSLIALGSPILGTPGGANVPSVRPNRSSVLLSFFCCFGAPFGRSDRRDGVLMG